MARMLGSNVYYGMPCSCCCGGRTVHAEKRREEQAWRREANAELHGTQNPVATAVERDCLHGCDGECLRYPGPHECGYTCHPGRLYESGEFEWAEPHRIEQLNDVTAMSS